jgi:hypothetical protein
LPIYNPLVVVCEVGVLMYIYRPHRGGLAESMSEAKEFNTKEEMFAHIVATQGSFGNCRLFDAGIWLSEVPSSRIAEPVGSIHGMCVQRDMGISTIAHLNAWGCVQRSMLPERG